MSVYFIQMGTDGPIKIGYAADPESRLKTLQTASPYKLRLLGTMPGGRAKEREIHESLSEWQMEGEWFQPVPQVLVHIEQRFDEEHAALSVKLHHRLAFAIDLAWLLAHEASQTSAGKLASDHPAVTALRELCRQIELVQASMTPVWVRDLGEYRDLSLACAAGHAGPYVPDFNGTASFHFNDWSDAMLERKAKSNPAEVLRSHVDNAAPFRPRTLEEQVFADRDCVIIYVRGPYAIDHGRCDSAERLRGWVRHLERKPWVTAEMLDRFIKLECQRLDVLHGTNLVETFDRSGDGVGP